LNVGAESSVALRAATKVASRSIMTCLHGFAATGRGPRPFRAAAREARIAVTATSTSPSGAVPAETPSVRGDRSEDLRLSADDRHVGQDTLIQRGRSRDADEHLSGIVHGAD
jgi:hypothetical protein